MILPTQASITDSLLAALSGPHDTVTYPGDLFSTVLTRLAFMEQHVLIKLEFQGSEPGYLVFQAGCAVYAQHGTRSGQAALDYFYMQGSNLTLRLFALSPVVATLVFAAIDGRQTDLGYGESWGLNERLTQLTAYRFTGMVAAKVSSGLGVWQFVQGAVRASQEVPGAGPLGAVVQLLWEERTLPALTVPQPLEVTPSSFVGVQAVGVQAVGIQATAGPALQSAAPALPPSPPPAALSAAPPTTVQAPPTVPQPGPPDDSAIWTLFQGTVHAHLGATSVRLVGLMQNKYGHEHGAKLLESLGLQIDRVAGKGAGQKFREQLY